MNELKCASDARRLATPARCPVPPPATYDGTLDDFIERYVLRNLPSPDAVSRFHRAFAAYVRTPDPLFLLRAVRATERRQIYATRDGTRFKATDNAPPWWVHAALLQDCDIAPGAFANVIATIPAHMFDVPPVTPPTASAAGWHIAHTFPVKDRDTNFQSWTRRDVVRRFTRNIHPCNYFLVAKTDWQRWGGDERVIGRFIELYRERYAAVWAEFLELARADEREIVHTAGTIRYFYNEAPRDAAPRSTSGVPQYRAARLTFKRDVIEPLSPNEAFRVVTPSGTFEMTKADFYRVFSNVPLTRSYREAGNYNYATLPRAAAQFLVADTDRP